MRLQRRESLRKVSPQRSTISGVPVPDAVTGLRIKILENIEYTPRVPADIKQQYAGKNSD